MGISRKQIALVRLCAVVGGIGLTVTMLVSAVRIGSQDKPQLAERIPAEPVSHSMEREVAQAQVPATPVLRDRSLPTPPTTPSADMTPSAGPLLAPPRPPRTTEPPVEAVRRIPTVSNAVPSAWAPSVREDLRPYTYTTSLKGINARLEPELRAAFNLGKSGALFAARSRFIGVMRKIALAKDAEEGTDRHAAALADGLRALDEADDFVPRGDALETELNTRAIARSHSTDVLDTTACGPIGSHEASALYSQHAAQRLGESVDNEEAGSMALFGLGKTYARLELQSEDATAGRKSDVMFRAAILAHEKNYMAANELGVRLSRAGWNEQALGILRLAAHQNPDATVYQNLATVEQKLGNTQQAAAIAQAGNRVAKRDRARGEVSRRHGIQWVEPEAFRRAGPASGTHQASAPQQVAMNTQASPPKRSSWRKAVDFAKRTTAWDTQPQQPSPSQPRIR